ncbi:hypothetical protein HanRHA438_Chr14g0631161 [Helianthus annuus]|nr:hypothetical protein HanRHA438_Chr14g0631161 [Helianthus annuus]
MDSSQNQQAHLAYLKYWSLCRFCFFRIVHWLCFTGVTNESKVCDIVD